MEDLTTTASKALRFMIASSTPIGSSYGDRKFDPLWAAAQEADTPPPCTPDRGMEKSQVPSPAGSDFHPRRGEIQTSLLEMIYGGVFDRFPV